MKDYAGKGDELSIFKMSDNQTVTGILQKNVRYNALYIPEGTRIIREGACCDLNVKTVILPNGLETIESCAFMDCKNFKRIYIPQSVKEIGKNVFVGCKQLKIYCEGEPQTGWVDKPDEKKVYYDDMTEAFNFHRSAGSFDERHIVERVEIIRNSYNPEKRPVITGISFEQFLKCHLKLNMIYQERKKNHLNLDGKLSEILLYDDVAQSFTSRYNLSLDFKNEIDKYIPEVSDCYKQEQRGDWHIYNVMEHILHSVDEMNTLSVGLAESERKLLAFTMFFHDLGKPEYHSVKFKNGKPCDSFKGHNIGSEKIAERVLKELDFSPEEQKIILTLVREHDVFIKFADEPMGDWQIKPTCKYLKQYIEGLNKFGDGKKIFSYLILVGIADNKAQNPKMTKESLAMISKIAKITNEI